MSDIGNSSLRITVVGDDEWRMRLAQVGTEIGQRIERAIEESALLVEGDIKSRIGGQHTGGRKRNRKGQYISSAKGKGGPQSPERSGPKPILNKRSGLLHRSVHHVVRRRGADSGAIVGTPTIYAKTHELGLEVGGVKMPERPFVAPSLEDKRSEILSKLRGALRKAVD